MFSIYEEVERDIGATGQAMAVVVLSSVAAGIGSAGGGLRLLIASTVAALVGWIVWAGLDLCDRDEVASGADHTFRHRRVAFARSVLQARQESFKYWESCRSLALSSDPLYGSGCSSLFVVAVRQALDYHGTGRAVLVCVIGFVAYVVVAFFLSALRGYWLGTDLTKKRSAESAPDPGLGSGFDSAGCESPFLEVLLMVIFRAIELTGGSDFRDDGTFEPAALL